MRKLVIVVLGVGLLGALAYGIPNGGFVRDAGWPATLEDLEGAWVLHEVRGEVTPAPPERIVFARGSAPDLVQVSDGRRSAEFRIGGAGRLLFGDAADFAPLLPEGATEVYSMTHLCPPLSAWDHLSFFPDGMPLGRDPGRTEMRYERD